MAIDVHAVTDFASWRLAAAADPEKAQAMARYLKTDMPFYGVQKGGRVPILRELLATWKPQTRAEYTTVVKALWELPHREEKYLAIGYARGNPQYISATSLPLYRRLIVEGAWWDLVDQAAIKLVGQVLRDDRARLTPKAIDWLTQSDLWLRRSAIISQVGHKADTDTDLLDLACTTRAHERDFFIRKAIGWALRDYAWTNPDWVARFVAAHEDALSPLSRREALKNIG